jgi:crossover junction endodeoxyribonuclease RusA
MHRLELPYPISTNRYWRIFRGMAVKSSEARQYKADVHAIAMQAGASEPLSGPIHVQMTYHPRRPKTYKGGPVRAFDLDNVAKVAIDSLNAIAWHDDKQITHLAISRGEPVPNGALIVQWRIDDTHNH